jgi:hypothetical protein
MRNSQEFAIHIFLGGLVLQQMPYSQFKGM